MRAAIRSGCAARSDDRRWAGAFGLRTGCERRYECLLVGSIEGIVSDVRVPAEIQAVSVSW
jgi:hypothetical protein